MSSPFSNQSFDLADPYLNTDAGTMSPFEHGEVFVLDDGGEVSRWTASGCSGSVRMMFTPSCAGANTRQL